MEEMVIQGRGNITLSVERDSLLLRFGRNSGQIKIVPIRSILCVEVAPPQENHRGYFYYRTPEAHKTIKPSVIGRDIIADDDIVYFEDDASYQAALKIQQYIATFYSSLRLSVADEIDKFHSLMERGVITKEEYEKKKKMLL